MSRIFSFLMIYLLITGSGVLAQNSGSESEETNQKENNSEQETAQPEKINQEQANEYPDPNLIPYRTKKSALVHVLSLPAKIWHLAWTPLGATVIWVEQSRIQEKAINFFLNDDQTAGFFPLVSFGGNTGAGGGLMVFDNNLFNKRKRIKASFLYSSSSNNITEIAYADSSLFGSSFYFDITGSYFNDSDENLYISDSVSLENLRDSSIGANKSTADDETSYATQEGGVIANLSYVFSQKVGLGIVSSFRRVDIDSSHDEIEGALFPRNIPGKGETSLFSVGGTLTFNLAKGWPRTLSGTLLRLSYTYNREINGRRFEYNRFRAELNQFIPIPFLAKNRRLGIRGVFEKIDRIGTKQVPFYELSLLGDAANLRGFDQNRFRGRGLLFFNFEYRYPIWDTWDAVLFFDEGQVYDDLSEIALNEFHTAVGTGIRFMSRTGFLMRFEVARSSEQWRALFQIIPNF
ncbi:BamA/TamA family outer membrane protein [candidate division KSB1 bacterium]|nr:BamA/TamA family outer membrane protein [candidate division KSB1 bacterium]